MSRIYDNPNQALYDTLIEIRSESIQTNNLLTQILEQLRSQSVRGEGEPDGD